MGKANTWVLPFLIYTWYAYYMKNSKHWLAEDGKRPVKCILLYMYLFSHPLEQSDVTFQVYEEEALVAFAPPG